jgi:hypothetical protein
LKTDANNCGACGQVCPSPSTQCVAGVCAGSGTAGDSCWSGLQCASGYCDISTFVCGTCQQGNYCDDYSFYCGGNYPYCVNGACSESPVGAACEYPSTAECGSAAPYCAMGVDECVSSMLGLMCGTNANCSPDAPYCDSGMCESTPQGMECNSNSDCPSGYPYCSRSYPNGCQASPQGEVCNSNADCPSNYPYCTSSGCSASLGSDGAYCQTNSDCASGSYCAYNACSNSPQGAYCTSNADCPASYPDCNNQGCQTSLQGSRCNSNADCSSDTANSFCTSSGCSASLGGQGATCYQNTDCSSGYCNVFGGEYCDTDSPGTFCVGDGYGCGDANPYCVNNACSASVQGATCYSNGDCGGDVPYCDSGTSICSSSANGAVCSSAADCPSGLYCVTNACTSALAEVGTWCNSNTDCASGYCVNRTCAVTLVQLGGRCNSNSDCASGFCYTTGTLEFCTSGTTGSLCAKDSECISQECSSDHCM